MCAYVFVCIFFYHSRILKHTREEGEVGGGARRKLQKILTLERYKEELMCVFVRVCVCIILLFIPVY